MGTLNKAITIAFRGDRQVIKAIKELADRRGTKMADLVYDTMIERWGDELNEIMPFFERDGGKERQSVKEKA